MNLFFQFVWWLALVVSCLALSACLGSKSAVDSSAQAASSGPQVSSLDALFQNSNLNTLIDMEARFVDVNEEVSGFSSAANLGSGAQAQYFQDSRFGSTQMSSLGNQESALGSQRALESGQRNAWQNQRFSETSGGSQARESGREFATGSYRDGERQFRSSGRMNRMDGRRAPGDDRSFSGTQDALATPRIPNIIGSLSEGGYMGQEQVQALTQ